MIKINTNISNNISTSSVRLIIFLLSKESANILISHFVNDSFSLTPGFNNGNYFHEKNNKISTVFSVFLKRDKVEKSIIDLKSLIDLVRNSINDSGVSHFGYIIMNENGTLGHFYEVDCSNIERSTKDDGPYRNHP